MIQSFGLKGQSNADINGDGLVNIADLVLVAGAIGDIEVVLSVDSQRFAMLTLADVQGWLAQAQGLDLSDAMLKRELSSLSNFKQR